MTQVDSELPVATEEPATVQLQPTAAMWECGPSEARLSDFSEKPETRFLCKNLLIFKRWLRI